MDWVVQQAASIMLPSNVCSTLLLLNVFVFLCSYYSQMLVSIRFYWVCYFLLFRAWVLIVQKFRAKMLGTSTGNPEKCQKAELLPTLKKKTKKPRAVTMYFCNTVFKHFVTDLNISFVTNTIFL